MQKINNKGFSVVMALVVVIVIATIGASGYFVWHKNKTNDEAKKTNDTKTSQKQNNTGSSTAQKKDPSEDGKYLVIAEWGVRVPMPEGLQGDVEYGIRKNVLLNDTAADGIAPIYGDVAYFASKELSSIQASPNNCGLKPDAHDDLNQRNDPTSYDGGPGIALDRSPQSLGGTEYHIGSYWYRISKGSAGGCYAGSDGTKEEEFISQVMTVLKEVQATPES